MSLTFFIIIFPFSPAGRLKNILFMLKSILAFSFSSSVERDSRIFCFIFTSTFHTLNLKILFFFFFSQHIGGFWCFFTVSFPAQCNARTLKWMLWQVWDSWDPQLLLEFSEQVWERRFLCGSLKNKTKQTLSKVLLRYLACLKMCVIPFCIKIFIINGCFSFKSGVLHE